MSKENKISHTSAYSLPSGTSLNQRYTLIKVLGEGGFGITYLGWDEVLQSPIAVKEFFPETLIGKEASSREEGKIYIQGAVDNEIYEKSRQAFLQEARNLSQFSGIDGIVQVRDYFQENDTAYIVMEYIDGISIKKYIRENGVMGYQQVLTIMEPVLKALQTIHKKQIIHRDLSADNIMLTGDGKLKLIDFGAARYTSAYANKTMTILFKRGFAAEEQYREKGEQGAWTDVYGISSAMYFMITGEVPEEAVERVICDKVVPLSERAGLEVPEDISVAIQKGMAVMAKDRYQTMEELYVALYQQKEEVSKSASEEIKISRSNVSGQKGHTITILGRELQLAISNRTKETDRKRITAVRVILVSISAILLCVGVGVFIQKNSNKHTKDMQADLLQETNLAQETPAGEASFEQKSILEDEKNENIVVVVPDILGDTEKEAKKKLKKVGLILGKRDYKYSNKKKGLIIQQEIPEGKKLIEGESISVVISKGKKKVTKSTLAVQNQGSNAKPTEAPTAKPKKDAVKDSVVGSVDSILE